MATPASVVTKRTVALSKLRLDAPNWTNIREYSGLEASRIAEMGESIKAKGVGDALKVQQIIINGDIHELVVDGQRRVLGAKDAGLPGSFQMPVVDIWDKPVELTPEIADELTLKALTTLERENLSSYELSGIAERMKRRGKTGEYIAAALQRSTTWVSRMLKARSTAAPKLMLQWRKGEITDEQFKELAEIASEEDQVRAVGEVADTRKSGDKAEARARTKEIVETARKTQPDKHHSRAKGPAPTNGVNGTSHPAPGRVVAGPQVDMVKGKDDAEPKKPTIKAPSRVIIDELLSMADKRPPVHDYVKGLMDGVKYAIGMIDAEGFAKPWVKYVSRIEGRVKPPKKAKPVKTAKAAKARKPAGKKAKTAKAKKGKRK